MLDEFIEQVKITHKGNKFEKEYWNQQWVIECPTFQEYANILRKKRHLEQGNRE